MAQRNARPTDLKKLRDDCYTLFAEYMWSDSDKQAGFVRGMELLGAERFTRVDPARYPEFRAELTELLSERKQPRGRAAGRSLRWNT